MAGLILIGAAVLLFARLGTYSLWTDEASTAISARGVWYTGDTTAWRNDHNLLTYRDGLLLKNQKDRYTSPLQFYVAAPFIGLLGETAFACRLPFAICGWLTVCIIVRWLWRARASAGVWIAAAIVLLTNASLFLFQRQCRYYALATLLSTAAAYLYCHWNGTRRQLLLLAVAMSLLLLAVAMSLLLSAQYLDYAAVVGCLVIDYGIWGRRRRAIRGINWLVLIVPQMLTAAVVCPIWNPIARAASAVDAIQAPVAHAAVAATSSHEWLSGFLTLFWWNIRDLLACDFAILPLLAVCPLIYFKTKNAWLIRAPVALLVFLGAISFFTAHPLSGQGNAEVRYLAPLLPLCVAIGVLGLWSLHAVPAWCRAPVLLTSCLSMAIAPAVASDRPTLQSSAIGYYTELWEPTQEPYSPLATWINANVPPRATVYVCPDWCVSPTMWDAPGPSYVWQLSDPPKADYANLPATFFKGRIPPDYLIGFGPFLDEIKNWQTTLARRGVRYEKVATIDAYWKEMFRPELLWRSSTTLLPTSAEKVYVFRRIR